MTDGVACRAVSLSSSLSSSLLIVVFDFKTNVKSLNSKLEQHLPTPNTVVTTANVVVVVVAVVIVESNCPTAMICTDMISRSTKTGSQFTRQI